MLLEETFELTPMLSVQLELVQPSPDSADAALPMAAYLRSPFASVRFHLLPFGSPEPVSFGWFDLFPGPAGVTPPAGQGDFALPGGTVLSTSLLVSLEINSWVVLSHYGVLPRLSLPDKAA